MRWRFWDRGNVDIDEAKRALERTEKKLNRDKSREKRVDNVTRELQNHNEFGRLWDNVLRERR